MGNDQVEGIISPAAAVVPPSHANSSFTSQWSDVPLCSSCPKKLRREAEQAVRARHKHATGSDRAVVVRKLTCECRCRTCFCPTSPHGTPGTPAAAPAVCEGAPRARYGHTLTAFEGANHFLLFGGTTYLKYFNDLWLLETAERRFTQQHDAEHVPSPRFGHTCHSDVGRLIMFGGSTNQEWFDEVYTIHSKPQPQVQQQQQQQSGPLEEVTTPRAVGQPPAPLTFDEEGDAEGAPLTTSPPPPAASSGRIVAFQRWPRRQPSAPWPCARRSHTFTHYKATTSVLYGGYCRVSLHDVWLLHMPPSSSTTGGAAHDGGSFSDAHTATPSVAATSSLEAEEYADLRWQELQTTGVDPQYPDARCPESRYCHTSAVTGDTLIVFGGYCATGVAQPVTWRLSLLTGVWEVVQVVGQVPRSRFGHTSSMIGNRWVVFGGLSSFPHGETLNDCFIFNLATAEWREVVSPLQPPRYADDDDASPRCLSRPDSPSTPPCDDGDNGVPQPPQQQHQQGSGVAASTSSSISSGGGGVGAVGLLTAPTAGASAMASALPTSEAAAQAATADLAGQGVEVHTIFGRRSHAAAVDPVTSSVVIFGGWNNQNVTDDFCFRLILAPPTLRELVRDFIGMRAI